MRGRLAYILLVTCSAACLWACSSVSVPTMEIRFLHHSNVVHVQGAHGGRTVSAAELAPVPGMPLLGFGNALSAVDVTGTNLSMAPVDNQGVLVNWHMEAHIFADDLATTNDALRFVGAAAAVEDWDSRATVQRRGVGLAIPYPPNPGWNLANRYKAGPPLLPIIFWPGVERMPPGSDPTGDGSVKSLRFYRPGVCSTEVPFAGPNNQGLFDRISDTLFARFGAVPDLDQGSAVRGYSRVTTLLDEGVHLQGPRGGVLLYFWFRATAAEGLQSVNFAANYEYLFGLQDGRVTLTPTRNDLLVQPQQSFGSFAHALEQELPQGVEQQFVDEQQAPPRPPPGQPDLAMPCDPNGDTANARGLYASAARQGGQALGFAEAEQQKLAGAVSQPASWRCDNGRARFILRARRINVYPDALELVWFDQLNVDDPMYALYAAAVSQQQAGALCSRPRTQVGAPGMSVRQRPITMIFR